MAYLTIYKDNYTESTAVPNYFIDRYMRDANDAQVKVYLYLLRMIHANLAFSVSDMADQFNHTEKDVLRALRYWEKQKLLTLEYDGNKNLTGLRLNGAMPPNGSGISPAAREGLYREGAANTRGGLKASADGPERDGSASDSGTAGNIPADGGHGSDSTGRRKSGKNGPSGDSTVNGDSPSGGGSFCESGLSGSSSFCENGLSGSGSFCENGFSDGSGLNGNGSYDGSGLNGNGSYDGNGSLCEGVSGSEASPGQQPETDPYLKPAYSADQLRNFKEQENIAQLLFVAEVYVGRPLTASDMKTILYFSDVLGFSDDLIDYLVQYCVDRGKKDFRYMEKVAVSWAQQGITTPGEAQKAAMKYDKSVYAIMNELGKSSAPTSKELEYINRWTGEYGFSADIIFEACERTVLAVDKHRFEYAEGILNSWRRENVRHKADIKRVDEQHQKQKGTARAASAPVSRSSGNKFNQFKQNSYDFDELEKELLSN